MPAEIGGYFYWQIYWLSPNLLADMVTFTKCGSINDGKQVLSPNLPADLLTVSKSAGRFAEFDQICWQKCGGQYFCWQINWLSQNWLAHLWTFTKSADRNGEISESKFTDCYQICWQRGDYICRNFTVSKSTGRFTDFHTNSSGRFPDFNTRSASRLTDSPNLLADLLTLTLNLPA